MAIARKQFLLAATAVVLLLLLPSHLPSCGPFLAQAIFTYRTVPALSYKSYVQGRLGVVQPTYWRKYLLIAYRYLDGHPLDQKEQEALLGPGDLDGLRRGSVPAPGRKTALQRWINARKEVASVPQPKEIEAYRQVPGGEVWQSFVNCLDPAFDTAVSTLEKRIASFGKESAAVKEWIAAQDMVFANCNSGAAIPPEVPAGAPAIVRADRAYQIASANFYAGKFQEAERGFRAIAADQDSPWSAIAPYLVARVLIRKATLFSKPEKPDLENLDKARQQLNSILQDPARKDLHAAAEGLLGYAEARLDPGGRLGELAARLSRSGSKTDFLQDVIDFQYLMDRAGNGLQPGSPTVRPTEDLTDWIETVQARDVEHSYEKWRQTRTTPWLVAALTLTPAGHTGLPELLETANKTDITSPAYPNVLFHRVRLMQESGKPDEVRQTIDSQLPLIRTQLPASSANLFLAERMKLARDLDEFAEFSQRTPAAVTYEGDSAAFDLREIDKGKRDPWFIKQTGSVLFDTDAADVINRGLPLSMLRQLAGNKALAPHLQRELVLVTWVRSVLLNEWKTADSLSARLGEEHPELKPFLAGYLSSKDDPSKRFAAAFLMLHFPGMKPYLFSGVNMRMKLPGIDDFRDNWWCALDYPDLDTSNLTRFWESGARAEDKDKAASSRPAPFLTPPQTEQLRAEWKQLTAAGTAPDYLSGVGIDWARKNPADPRVPEALHLAVRSTRYGCAGKSTSSFSKAAFEILHKNYRDTDWAKRTKYWY